MAVDATNGTQLSETRQLCPHVNMRGDEHKHSLLLVISRRGELVQCVCVFLRACVCVCAHQANGGKVVVK